MGVGIQDKGDPDSGTQGGEDPDCGIKAKENLLWTIQVSKVINQRIQAREDLSCSIEANKIAAKEAIELWTHFLIYKIREVQVRGMQEVQGSKCGEGAGPRRAGGGQVEPAHAQAASEFCPLLPKAEVA